MTSSRGRDCCWGETVSTAWQRLGWPCSALAAWAAMRWRRWPAAAWARSISIDSDTVDPTNLNRQIIATMGAIGRPKTQVAAERVASINPSCIVRPRQCFFLPETADQFDFAAFDYVIDAVDTVSAKIALVEAAFAAGVPIVSSMGAGNKLDPTAFRVADIYETSVDPLARVMRRELRRRGIPSLKVVYSTEPPLVPADDDMAVKDGTRPAPGSVAFVPSVAGLILGGEVVKDLAAC